MEKKPFNKPTTIHAIPNIINSQILIIKLMWLVFFVTSCSVFLTNVINIVRKYQKYETKIQIKIGQLKRPEFPAVTICNQNPFNNKESTLAALKKGLKKLNLSEALQSNSYQNQTISNKQIVLKRKKRQTLNNCTTNSSNSSTQTVVTTNTEQFYSSSAAPTLNSILTTTANSEDTSKITTNTYIFATTLSKKELFLIKKREKLNNCTTNSSNSSTQTVVTTNTEQFYSSSAAPTLNSTLKTTANYEDTSKITTNTYIFATTLSDSKALITSAGTETSTGLFQILSTDVKLFSSSSEIEISDNTSTDSLYLESTAEEFRKVLTTLQDELATRSSVLSEESTFTFTLTENSFVTTPTVISKTSFTSEENLLIVTKIVETTNIEQFYSSSTVHSLSNILPTTAYFETLETSTSTKTSTVHFTVLSTAGISFSSTSTSEIARSIFTQVLTTLQYQVTTQKSVSSEENTITISSSTNLDDFLSHTMNALTANYYVTTATVGIKTSENSADNIIEAVETSNTAGIELETVANTFEIDNYSTSIVESTEDAALVTMTTSFIPTNIRKTSVTSEESPLKVDVTSSNPSTQIIETTNSQNFFSSSTAPTLNSLLTTISNSKALITSAGTENSTIDFKILSTDVKLFSSTSNFEISDSTSTNSLYLESTVEEFGIVLTTLQDQLATRSSVLSEESTFAVTSSVKDDSLTYTTVNSFVTTPTVISKTSVTSEESPLKVHETSNTARIEFETVTNAFEIDNFSTLIVERTTDTDQITTTSSFYRNNTPNSTPSKPHSTNASNEKRDFTIFSSELSKPIPVVTSSKIITDDAKTKISSTSSDDFPTSSATNNVQLFFGTSTSNNTILLEKKITSTIQYNINTEMVTVHSLISESMAHIIASDKIKSESSTSTILTALSSTSDIIGTLFETTNRTTTDIFKNTTAIDVSISTSTSNNYIIKFTTPKSSIDLITELTTSRTIVNNSQNTSILSEEQKTQIVKQTLFATFDTNNTSTAINQLIDSSLAAVQDFSDDELQQLGVSYTDLVKSLSFLGSDYTNCNECSKRFWHFSYGNCYTFHPQSFTRNINDNNKGSLIFQVYTGDPLLGSKNGIIVFIHNESTTSVLLDEGILLSAGFEATLEVRRTFRKLLPKPYSNCISDLNEFKVQNGEYYEYMKNVNLTEYNQIFCNKLCYQRKLIDQCNCSDYTIPKIAGVANCLNKNETNCQRDVQIKISMSDVCLKSCPLQCNSIKYQSTLHLSNFPSVEYAKILKKFVSDIPPNTKDVYKYLKSRMAKVVIKYYYLSYNSYDYLPSMTTNDLFGKLGGQIGLFIGASILSAVEVFNLINEIVRLLNQKFNS